MFEVDYLVVSDGGSHSNGSLDARAYVHREVSQSPQNLCVVGKGDRDAMMYPEVARICQRVYQASGSIEDAFREAMARQASLPA